MVRPALRGFRRRRRRRHHVRIQSGHREWDGLNTPRADASAAENLISPEVQSIAFIFAQAEQFA